MVKNSMEEDQIELIYLMAFLMPASLSSVGFMYQQSEKIALTCVPRALSHTHASRPECFIHDTYTIYVSFRM